MTTEREKEWFATHPANVEAFIRDVPLVLEMAKLICLINLLVKEEFMTCPGMFPEKWEELKKEIEAVAVQTNDW